MFEIRKYNDADKEVWNAYVEHARNATFLLNRSYMDYHSDRFHDHSLMISTTTSSMPYSLPMRTEMFSILIRDSPMPDCSLPDTPQQKISVRFSLPSTHT